MHPIYSGILLTISLAAFFISIKGLYQSAVEKNALGDTIPLFWLGIFVWGDATVVGPFWLLASLSALLLEDWILFLLFTSVFWLIRSIGETLYWFLQQFSTLKRNPPQKMRGYRFFHNDSIWFVYQLFWQCITIFSCITTAYLLHAWLT